jgi:hypothetical protein
LLAAAAGLPGNYVPWLSTTKSGPVLAPNPTTAIVTPTCALIAKNLADLESSGPTVAINVTEMGMTVPDSPCLVWTATTAAGAPFFAGGVPGNTCDEWRSNDDGGIYSSVGDCALSGDAGSVWTYFEYLTCDVNAGRLYCLQN